jgi:hypothetical protein
VDVGDVPLDGIQGDHQLLRDRPVGHAGASSASTSSSRALSGATSPATTTPPGLGR